MSKQIIQSQPLVAWIITVAMALICGVGVGALMVFTPAAFSNPGQTAIEPAATDQTPGAHGDRENTFVDRNDIVMVSEGRIETGSDVSDETVLRFSGWICQGPGAGL